MQLPQLAAALGLAALVALISRLCSLLTATGALAAFTMGALIFGLGGWRAALPILAFFFTSSLLSILRRRFRAVRFAKDGPRNASQVFANAGVAAAALTLGALYPQFGPGLWAMVYASSLAAATADTWATEIGGMASGMPRLITTMRPAAVGTSGAISITGLTAGAAGAALVALSSAFLPGASPRMLLACVIAGISGMLSDSLLGATLQARYKRPDGTLHEEPAEGATRVSGMVWLNNDGVNFLATLAAALVALLAYGVPKN